MTRLFVGLTVATPTLCFGAERVDAKALAGRIGTNSGIAVVLGAPDPQFAVEFARATELTVYVQSADVEQVRAARAAAEAAGLLGRRIFIDQGEPGRIQLAGNVADAILVTDVALAGGDAGQRELIRVLCPGGKAIVGDKQIVKPAPAGTDSWSHPYHGPDNNPLSADQLARAPYTTQFLAEPLFSSQPEVTVAAGGRVFKAFGHMTFRAYQNASINTLFGMSAYNGAILWKRTLKPGFMIHRNTMIATAGTLYMADEESCKLMDAATGKIVDQIIPPADQVDGPVWKWMAIENNVLYAMLGPAEVQAPVAKGTDTRIGGWPWAMWPGYDYADPKTAWGFGRSFIAIDLKTRKILWNYRAEQPLDSRGVCMKDGRIYFFCPGKFLGAIDTKTGLEAWRTSDAALLAAIGPNEKAQFYVTGFATTTYIKCNNHVLMFAGPQRSSLVAVSADDGKLLWQRKGGNFQLVLRYDAIFALGDQFGKSFKFDYLTGKVLGEFVGRRACTRATGTIDSVFCRATEGTIRWDVASNALQHISPMRPACHDGVIVSDGLLYWGPWICGCQLSLVGIICATPASDATLQPPLDQPGQLQTFRKDPGQVQPFNTAPADWPAYQGNNQRTRVTAATIPPDAALKWTWKPASPIVPTAPVAAGGAVFVAGSDGLVRSIDAATGQLRWKADTAGSIFFPPAIDHGRAYVGSNDGRVYAFEAATGNPLWRFRAAPSERKIPVYGQLASTWPVAGGVLVSDGILYAAAGISHFDGTHVYALDAITGLTKWHNDSSGKLDPDVQNGVSLCGNLRLDGDALSFPGGNVYAVATYDTRTGQCRNKPAGAHTTRRVFLWPRSLWEPIETDDLSPAPGARLQLRSDRGGRKYLSLHLPGMSQPSWSMSISAYAGSVAVSTVALVLARPADTENGQPVPYRLLALNHQGKVLWSHPMPAAPVHWGLAVDSQGSVVVSLEDGQVLCFGVKDVAR
jgi:outer membrane protein assembly factor BamB